MGRDLRLLAYEIVDKKTDINFYITEFPNKWYDKLLGIYKVILGRDKVMLPYESLNSALEALPLSIVETGKVYKKEAFQKPWIVALDDIDKTVILNVVRSWCTVEFLNKYDIESDLKEKVIEIMEGFKEEDIKTNKQVLDLSRTEVWGNGTSNPNSYIYSILGSYIAQVIAERQIPLKIEDEVFYFMKNKNSIISYPVKEFRGFYYSIAVCFSVKTMPTYDKPILLVDTSVKRWANGKLANTISWKEKTSVFIKYNKDILQNNRNGYTLGNDRICRDKEKKCYCWADNVKDILEDKTIKYLPQIEEVLENSKEYVNKNQDYTMLIAYNNANASRINHPVKKGMSMEEQYTIYKQMIDKFDFLKPINNNQYEDVKGKYSGSKLKNIDGIIDYINTFKSDDEIVFEVLYINKKTPEIVLQYVLEELNAPKEAKHTRISDKESLIEYKGIKIKIIYIFTPNLAEEMESFDDKINQVKGYLEVSSTIRLSIVEIMGKDSYSKNKDPKFAIRKGLYQLNRLNQFIDTENILSLEVEDKDKKEKAEVKVKSIIKNVFLELFRQLGIMFDEIRVDGLKGIPKELSIVGFNLLSTNNSIGKDTLGIPVAVNITTGKKDIYIRTPMNDDWMKYTDAILKFGSMNYRESNNMKKLYSKEEVNKFFISIINDIKDEEALVLVDTSNRLNSFMPEFQDKNINVNGMYNEYKNIRFIRVKNNWDIPKFVGINSEDKAFFTSGVKKIVDNVYYSLEGKSTTYKSIKPDERKLVKPSKEFKSPNVLEIVPAKMNEGDNKDSFIYFTHMLRDLNITYKGYSSVPVVNHLAKSFKEVFIVQDEQEEESET